jgi:hypothetical protein
MAVDPRLRASDDDRDRTATLLREHHAAGRLTPEEFNERLDKTFAAKTMGDLDELLADLPSIDLYRLPGAGVPNRAAPGASSHLAAMASAGLEGRQHGRLSPGWRAAWASFLGTAVVLIVIWTVLGLGYPWFLWVIGPWGVGLFARWIAGGEHPPTNHDHGHHRDHRDRRDGRDELPDDRDRLSGPPQ